MAKGRIFLKLVSRLSGVGLLMATLMLQAAEAARLNDIRVWHAPDHTRIVMDLDRAPQFKHFYLADPARFVVDLPGFGLSTRAPEKAKSGPYLKGIRIGQQNPTTARIVLDLKVNVKIKTLLLAPVPGFQHRLVLDIYPKNPLQKGASSQPRATSKNIPLTSPPSKTRPQPAKKVDNTIIIAIDAGHGGEDSGARGRRTKEKDVALQIAKRLQKKIDAQTGLKAILTRKGDYFISLRNRTRVAREAGADLFISIHADAFKNNQARGSSVYRLSLRGASSENARLLADKENSADLAGGVNISERDDTLAKILLDMQWDATKNEIIPFADEVLKELKKIGKVHSPSVEKAGFVVLKSPDIPSILVETAYITNRTEEKLLRSASHQEKLANAILIGTKNYLKGSSYHTATLK
ncbi:MAG: AMIN domain-containing protein [Proteobacteria bacterium]|nr:AMIN domain-containing protein [Pseudomonadota bacterium]